MKYKKTIVWVVIIAIWFILTIPALNLVNQSLIPSPMKVVNTFFDILKNGYNSIPFYKHLGASFGRLFLAIFLAIITAIPLGLLSGYVKKIETVISSIVEFVRPLPPLAYYMLLILWMGIGDTSKVVLLFIAAFAPIYIACVQAVKLVKEDYVLSAKSLGATNFEVFKNVVFPSALPNIFTGVRTAIGVAYTTLVSAEMVASVSGIGWMILDASNYLKSDVIFVGIIIIGVSAILIDKLVQALEKRLVFWKGKE
ncbi:MAG: ABC transporter permease [Acholeplasma sp.]|nr:ABC transporter permease [Acholeplasma sp.]